MCGILGAHGPYDKKNFIKSINLQKHRGPDDFGYMELDEVKLGHRRLSIIDVSKKSHQPMKSKNERYTIVFNGEIYNFNEIKKKLKKNGINFFSNGDTEVLLNAYIFYGERVLEHLRGMFAFCIYDKIEKSFFIARDRLGIKPLYYHHSNGKFIFSSEIKSILNLIENYTLNLNSVSSYLSFRYTIGEETFFNEIKELPPSFYLKYKDNKVSLKEYWSLKKLFLNKKNFRYNKSRLLLKKILEKSIKLRTISDVPVGAFLSGGLDSSLLTSILSKKKLISKKLHTYTVGIKNDRNEFEYAQVIKKKYNLNHHEILIDRKKYLSSIAKLIKFKDSPLGIPNEILLYYMAKNMKKNISVVLSGEGADELFAGYGRIYGIDEDFKKLKNKNKNKILKNKLIQKYKKLNFSNEFDHFLNQYEYFSLSLKKKIFKNNFNVAKIEKSLKNKLGKHFPISKKINYFDSIMYFFLKVHVRGLLNRIDAMTMASGIEARVPFLDHHLVNLAINIPKKFKIKKYKNFKYDNFISDEISEKKSITKFILKDAYKNLIPDKIIQREKLGFPVSLENVFNNNNIIEKLVIKFNNSILLNKFFKKSVILKLLKKKNKNYKESFLIWMLLNLIIFYKIYFN